MANNKDVKWVSKPKPLLMTFELCTIISIPMCTFFLLRFGCPLGINFVGKRDPFTSQSQCPDEFDSLTVVTANKCTKLFDTNHTETFIPGEPNCDLLFQCIKYVLSGKRLYKVHSTFFPCHCIHVQLKGIDEMFSCFSSISLFLCYWHLIQLKNWIHILLHWINWNKILEEKSTEFV